MKRINVRTNIDVIQSVRKALYVGGICGYAESSTISNCSNLGTITVSSNISYHSQDVALCVIGGICGNTQNSTVSGCSNLGTITASSSIYSVYVGGICGNAGGTSSSISSCSNLGTITASNSSSNSSSVSSNPKDWVHAGGISGGLRGTVNNCYNVGNIIANGINCYVSGIGGRFSTVENCYNIGTLTGNGTKVGCSEENFTNCYYLSTCGATTGGTSKTEAEMKAPSFVDLLNGSNIYFMVDATPNINSGYPILATLATDEATEVFGVSATLNGHIIPPFTATTCGFKYRLSTETDYTDVTATANGDNYSANLTGLAPSSTYSYYFYAVKDGVTYSGSEKQFSSNFRGTGTEVSPYLIENVDQLNQLAELVNTSSTSSTYRTKHYKLMADLVVAGDYIPIGSSATTSFRGTFDGNGHTIEIQNMAIGIQYAGIFGYVRTATIYNLGATGSWSSDAEYAGGIVGYMHSSTVRGCYNMGDISGTREGNGVKLHVGGIVGYMRQYVSTEPKSELSDCYNEGAISGVVNRSADESQNHAYIGGIAGDVNTNSDVNTCYNTGAISCQMGGTGTTQSYARVGGIAGRVTDNASVMFCSNQGAVSGNATIQTALAFVGGIAGVVETSNRDYNDEPTLQVVACYNTGDISGNAVTGSSVRIGGISGEMFRGKLSSCYNIGSVSGTTNSSNFIGGIVGNPLSTYTLENVYYLNTSVTSGNAYGTSKTAEQMKTPAFLAELDPEGAYFSGVQNEYPRFLQVATLGVVDELYSCKATVYASKVEDFTATSYHFACKKASEFTYTEVTATQNNNEFSAELTALEPNTTYKYYFLARTSTETIFGAEKEFTTPNNATITIMGPTDAVCADGDFNLTASVIPEGTYTYQWYKDATPITGATSEVLPTSTNAAAIYKVVATDEYGCTAEGTYTITVNVNPTITITPIADALCPNKGTQNLTATCAGGQGTYTVEWSGDLTYSNSSVSGSTATTTATIPTNCNATYTVTATVTDGNGCHAESTITLTVKDDQVPTFTRPNDIEICRNADGTTYDASPEKTGNPTNVADNCSSSDNITTNYSDVTSAMGTDGVTTITRTWKATDACNNVSDGQIQTIIIKASLITADVQLSCYDMNITMAYGFCDTLITLTSATHDAATKLPNRNVTLTCTNTAGETITSSVRLPEGSHTFTWTLKDEECGHKLTCTQTVTITYPPCGETLTDSEGNSYNTVRLGCECWMAENLRATQYSNGSPIANYRAYQDSNSLANIYGLLYSWYSAANVPEGNNTTMPTESTTALNRKYVQGACPTGWALPTEEDYLRLEGLYADADALKSTETTTWLPDHAGIAPVSGFNAKAAGYYNIVLERYEEILGTTYFWTRNCGPVDAGVFGIRYHCESVLQEQHNKGNGYSIRCLRRE